MKRRRELAEVIFDIRNEIPGFNKEDLVVKCKSELINKLNKESAKYRINKDIDHISIQYVELFDSIKKDNEMYIQFYLSIYFYDDVDNNIGNYSMNDKYWNDIWIVTYRECVKSEGKKSNCDNCGATMKYNQLRDTFECEYCGNVIHNNSNSKWEIVDIELGN